MERMPGAAQLETDDGVASGNAATAVNSDSVPSGGVEPPGPARSQAQHPRRLLIRPELLGILQLSGEQVQGLIETRQITVIRIAGEERFDSREVDRLIDIYRTTAHRRAG